MSPISITCLMAVLSGSKNSKQIWAYAQSDIMTLGYLKRGGVYKALPRLVEEKLLSKIETTSTVSYQITPRGKMLLKAEARRMQDLSAMLRQLPR